MGKYFGTDGFRGEANVDLTVEHAYKVGRFLGWYYGKDHKAQIVIGKDTRRSSYMFEYSLVAGLTASGADVYLLHVTTTPSVSYVVRTENFDCGIMISASHNPFYDNGIKIIGGNGQKMDAEVEAMIEVYIDDDVPKIPFATKENIGRTVDFSAGRNRYIGYLISIPIRSFKNYRVGLDCANGSASSVAKSVFDALGAKTYVINNEPDGTNINTNCGSTHIEVLQQFVKEKHLDVGFAYDGDADRCIAVDHLGNVVDGDLILYICGKYMKETGKLENNTIVTTIMSNLGRYTAERTQPRRRTVRSYHFQQTCNDGRRYPDLPDADGSDHREKTAVKYPGIRGVDLSAASGKCPGCQQSSCKKQRRSEKSNRIGGRRAGRGRKNPRKRERYGAGDPCHGRSQKRRDLP